MNTTVSIGTACSGSFCDLQVCTAYGAMSIREQPACRYQCRITEVSTQPVYIVLTVRVTQELGTIEICEILQA